MLGSRRVRTLTVSVTAVAGLLAPVLVTGAGPAQAAAVNYGKVVFVDDGDTIDVDVAGDGTGRPVRVRYIGIQSMELSRTATRCPSCAASAGAWTRPSTCTSS